MQLNPLEAAGELFEVHRDGDQYSTSGDGSHDLQPTTQVLLKVRRAGARRLGQGVGRSVLLANIKALANSTLLVIKVDLTSCCPNVLYSLLHHPNLLAGLSY